MTLTRVTVWTAVNALACTGFLVMAWLCFNAGRLFPYEDVVPYLTAHSNREAAAFFTQEYYAGVLERARWSGWLSIGSALLFLCGVMGRNHVRAWLDALPQVARTVRSALYTVIKAAMRDRLLMLILLVAVAVRLLYLFQPVSSDEARAYYAWTARPFILAVSDYRAPQHLLYTILDYGVVRVFGNAEWSIRLPAFLAGIALPLLVFGLGKQMAGRGVGYMAAVLVATSPVLVHYSVNGRAYTLHACAVAGLWYAAWRIRSAGGLPAYLLLIACGVLGLMAIPTMIYPLVGTFAWLALGAIRDARTDWKRAVRPVVQCGAAGLMIVWGGMLAYLPAYVASDEWYSVDGADVAGVVPWADLPGRLGQFTYGAFRVWNMDVPVWLVIILVMFCAAGLWQWRRHGGLTLLVWNVIAVLAVLVVLRVIPYPRTITYLAVAFLLLAAVGMDRALKNLSGVLWPRRLYDVTPALVMAALGASLLVQNKDGITAKGFDVAPGVRDAMKYLKSVAEPGDHIISSQPASAPIHYYHLRYGMDNHVWFAREAPPPRTILDEEQKTYFVVNSHSRQSLWSLLRRCRWADREEIDARTRLVYSNAYCRVYLYEVE